MKAIVIGGDHHNALGVIRALGRMGVAVDFYVLSLDDNDSYVASSKYVSNVHYHHSADELGDALIRRPKLSEGKEVIFCCHDALASMLDCRQNEFIDRFHFPHSDKGLVSELQNKKQMGKLAHECGLIIPEDTQDFPLILKPLNSVNGKKDDIAICMDQKSFDEYFMKHSLENTLVQRYIQHQQEYQLIGCVTADSAIIIPGYSSILRPCKGSNTSFLKYQALPDGFCDIESCKNFLKRTGFHGLFSMEFVRDADGLDYFLEINFRNDGNAICVTDSGINLPMIWYKSCINADYSDLVNNVPEQIYVIPEFEELTLLTTRQISLREIISDYRKASAGMEWDKHDIMPFFKLLKKRIIHKLKA